ncbi:MAG: hypothetical protein HFJ73_02850 [Eggerthellaceae bacterium]|jgi:uncharacterized repeat protein (TIGR02543 family)|nr:hypothetical protein [Eggerthellaceae bacterium]
MRKSVASFAHKTIALCAALALSLSVPSLAWAEGNPSGTIAGTVAGSAAEAEEGEGMPSSGEPDAQGAPEASAQSASTKAADGSGTGGTTVSIAVYRSSFPITKWDLNDDDYSLTKAEWDNRPANSALPQQGSPGSEVEWPEAGMPAGYKEPVRAGFEFAGWSVDKSASAGGYIDGSSPALTMPEGAPTSDPKEYTLYALWTPNEYSVVFDLSKNPESKKGPGDDASFKLNWSTSDGVRTVTDLGQGRFHVDGFTMKEAHYDSATRTVGLPEPARSGYRFLGWAEPDGQDLAIDNADKTGYAMNPVRLTQINGTPILTARWTSAFGVTAPLSITFGDYDVTGAPGNPWLGDKNQTAGDDTTQSEADDTAKDDREGYEALGQAYFENTGWHEAVKVVGLASERYASANQVLTTYDTKKASEAQVLGDGTEANPGERLLSLYPSASAPGKDDDKSSGIHFRLTDAVSEGALGDAFTMAPQGEDGSKKAISYGLNLSTDPTDGSANHGLVLPTNDYERKQIATVSYTFAAADVVGDKILTPDGDASAFYIDIPQEFIEKHSFTAIADPGIYGVRVIKEVADNLAAKGSASPYYGFCKSLMDSQGASASGGSLDGPYFKLALGSSTWDVQILGIAQDYLAQDDSGTRYADERKAGLSFALRDIYTETTMRPSSTNTGSWANSSIRTYLHGTFYQSLPEQLKDHLAVVSKRQQKGRTDSFGYQQTSETVFLPGFFEVYGARGGYDYSFYNYNADETYAKGSFQYQTFLGGNDGTTFNRTAAKKLNGQAKAWWCRSSGMDAASYLLVNATGERYSHVASGTFGVVPCFCL